MPKRKREDDDETPNIKLRRVQHKLKLGITKLGHAFKVSKGFERQKLGRRRKNASSQSNSKDVDRIDSEIAALKTLETTSVAKQHLYKSLLKIKAVSQHPDLPPEVKKGVAIPSDAATLNVNARLCKSKPVQDALSTALDDIQRSLGLDAGQAHPGKARRVRAKDFVKGQAVSKDLSSRVAGDDDDDGGQSDSVAGDRSAVMGHKEPLSDDEIDPEQSRQIATSETSEDNSTHLPRNGYDLEADLSISGSESGIHSNSPEPQKAQSSIKKSSYLPSLTMAGYISGSDSDVPDDVELGPRKNRRGQRARQQIWEKKYGMQAKHLQKKKDAVRWDAKRGAVDGNSRGRFQRSKRPDSDYSAGGDGGAPKQRTETQPPMRKVVDRNAPIHPSWEAAKKAKEKRESTVAFQGKKVTFD